MCDVYSVTTAISMFHRHLVLPPSGAVTGVYAYTDTSRGVWKAPANVPLNDVLEPAVKLDSERQGPLNVDPTTGKSINALRAFAGKGTLVWGARTLSREPLWRYVNVRRVCLAIIKNLLVNLRWTVFEPKNVEFELESLASSPAALRAERERRSNRN